MSLKKLLNRARNFYSSPIFVIGEDDHVLSDAEILQRRIQETSFVKKSVSDQMESTLSDFEEAITLLKSQLQSVNSINKKYIEDKIERLEKAEQEEALILATNYNTQKELLDNLIKADISQKQIASKKKSKAKYSVGLIKNNEGKILFLYRQSDKDIAPNSWCLPGGHIDDGETPKAAAIREIKEESNLLVDECWLNCEIETPQGETISYFNCSIDWSNAENAIALLDSEHTQYRFMSEEEWLKEELIFDLADHLEYIYNKSDFDEISSKAETLDIIKGVSKAGQPGYVRVKVLIKPSSKKPYYAYRWMKIEAAEAQGLIKKKEEEKSLTDEQIQQKYLIKGKYININIDGEDINGRIGYVGYHDKYYPKGRVVIDQGGKKYYKSLPKVIESLKKNSKVLQVVEKEQPKPEYDVDGYKFIKKLGGSTGAELVEDKNGDKWVKKITTKEHRESEYWANLLYQEYSNNRVALSRLTDSAYYTKYVGGAFDKTLGQIEDPTYKDILKSRLKKDFVLDALLGNWDVVGQDQDNVLVKGVFESITPVYKIDQGGALSFRAQGEKKDNWGEQVFEIKTMRDSKINPQAARIFENLTEEEIALQVAKLPNKLPSAFDTCKDKDILNARLKWLKQNHGIVIDSLEGQIKLYPDSSPNLSHSLKKFYKDLNKILSINEEDEKWMKENLTVAGYDDQAFATEKGAKSSIQSNNYFQTEYVEELINAGLTYREIFAINKYTGQSYKDMNRAINALVNIKSDGNIPVKMFASQDTNIESYHSNYNDEFYQVVLDGAKTVNHHISLGNTDFNQTKLDNIKKLKMKLYDSIDKLKVPLEQDMATHYIESIDKILEGVKNNKTVPNVKKFEVSKKESDIISKQTKDALKDAFDYKKYAPGLANILNSSKQRDLIEAKFAISGLAKASKSSLVKTRNVYRKIDASASDFISSHSVGSEVISPRFNSTSAKQSVWSGNIKMTIKTKTGLSVSGISNHPTEAETLIMPFRRFEVVGYQSTKPFDVQVTLKEL